MLAIAIVLLLQQPPAAQPAELPVSFDRIREGLARPGRFDPPPPRAWRVFRTRIEGWIAFEDKPWESRSPTPLWVQPSAPPAHFEFLQSTTPEEFRAATVHPCCDVIPAITTASRFIGKQVRSIKERRAKREVERAMQAAGIR